MITRRARISKQKQNQILAFFTYGTHPAKSVASFLGVNRHTIESRFDHFREVVWEHCLKAGSPRFSGEVEIDQCRFGNRSVRRRVSGQKSRRKEILGHVNVLGFFERKTGKVYTRVIKDQSEKTILPLIRLVVEEGSTIYTDEHLSFRKLKDEGYKHESVNHSTREWARSRVYTSSIDRYWQLAHRKMEVVQGLPRYKYPLYLKAIEFCYNSVDRTGKTSKDLSKEAIKRLIKTRLSS